MVRGERRTTPNGQESSRSLYRQRSDHPVAQRRIEMIKKRSCLLLLFLLFFDFPLAAQMTPWLQWTFLRPALMDEIIGEASGETGANHVMAMCGFPRDRKSAEYAGTFAEAQYVLDRLKESGLPEAAILRYPGGETWDGVRGELWEVRPAGRRSLPTGTSRPCWPPAAPRQHHRRARLGRGGRTEGFRGARGQGQDPVHVGIRRRRP